MGILTGACVVVPFVTRFGIPVCPHAGGVGLCEYVIHLRSVDLCRFPFVLSLTSLTPQSD